jgi:hypothetical protein
MNNVIGFWPEYKGNYVLGPGLSLTVKRLGYSRHTEAVFFRIGQRIHVRGQEPKIVVHSNHFWIVINKILALLLKQSFRIPLY